MKKKLLMLIGIFLLCKTVNTSAMSLKIDGDKIVKPGEKITLYLKLVRNNNEKKVTAVDGKLSFSDNNLSLESSEVLLSDWTCLSKIDSQNKFAYANMMHNNMINALETNIVKMVFKVKSDVNDSIVKFSIDNPSATDENDNLINIKGETFTLEIKNTINKSIESETPVSETDVVDDPNESSTSTEKNNSIWIYIGCILFFILMAGILFKTIRKYNKNK